MLLLLEALDVADEELELVLEEEDLLSRSFLAEAASFFVSEACCDSVTGAAPRLSVLYQPLPLKTTVGALNWRRAGSPHSSHGCCGGAPKGSRFS